MKGGAIPTSALSIEAKTKPSIRMVGLGPGLEPRTFLMTFELFHHFENCLGIKSVLSNIDKIIERTRYT